MKKLIDQLKRHEGYRQFPYKCSAGALTVGYGRNLDANGVGKGEAESMLWLDVSRTRAKLEKYPTYHYLDEVRQMVLINMGFNLGIDGLMKFRRMWAALIVEDYENAAKEMLSSRWARQVGSRADELAEQMRTGEWV